MKSKDIYNFQDSIFSEGEMFGWCYGLENAKLVAYNATRTNSVFELFCYFAGFDELNLHSSIDTIVDYEIRNEIRNLSASDLQNTPFFHSNLSEIDYFNTLPISKWDEDIIVGSALFFILQDLIDKKKNFLGVRYVIEKVTPLVLSDRFYKIAIGILINTHLIKNNFKECCIGFQLGLRYEYFTYQLQQDYGFNENVLIAFLNLIQVNIMEIETLVKSCFEGPKFENKIFFLKKILQEKINETYK